MLLNNIRNGRQFNYFQIVFDGKQWVAWFLKESDIAEEAQPLTQLARKADE
jgi:hypothetical protein